jgi:hypothetical protein
MNYQKVFGDNFRIEIAPYNNERHIARVTQNGQILIERFYVLSEGAEALSAQLENETRRRFVSERQLKKDTLVVAACRLGYVPNPEHFHKDFINNRRTGLIGIVLQSSESQSGWYYVQCVKSDATAVFHYDELTLYVPPKIKDWFNE